MKAVPKTGPVKKPSHDELGLRVAATNACHHSASRRLVDNVSHAVCGRPLIAVLGELGAGSAAPGSCAAYVALRSLFLAMSTHRSM